MKFGNMEMCNSKIENLVIGTLGNFELDTPLIDRLLKVNGSWLKPHGSCLKASAKFFLAMSLEPRALRHEP